MVVKKRSDKCEHFIVPIYTFIMYEIVYTYISAANSSDTVQN